MADCFSLKNKAELVKELRDLEYAKGNALSWVTKAKMRSLMLEAADTVEACRMEIAGLRMRRDELYGKIDQLELENAKLKAERDAAVKDLKDFSDSENSCFYCRKINSAGCTECIWEWRGVKEEE